MRANEDLQQDNGSQLIAGEVQEIIEEEERKEGKVEFAVYRWVIFVVAWHFTPGGCFFSFFFLLKQILQHIFETYVIFL